MFFVSQHERGHQHPGARKTAATAATNYTINIRRNRTLRKIDVVATPKFAESIIGPMSGSRGLRWPCS